MVTAVWGAILLKHFMVFIGIILVFILLYKPPSQAAGLRDFVERHFGDSLGLYILHLGVILVLLGGFYTQVASVGTIGQSLIMAALVALKLKTVPGAGNGNGDGNGGPSQRVVSTTETTSVSVGSPPIEKHLAP